jgi:hypothetical protein
VVQATPISRGADTGTPCLQNVALAFLEVVGDSSPRWSQRARCVDGEGPPCREKAPPGKNTPRRKPVPQADTTRSGRRAARSVGGLLAPSGRCAAGEPPPSLRCRGRSSLRSLWEPSLPPSLAGTSTASAPLRPLFRAARFAALPGFQASGTRSVARDAHLDRHRTRCPPPVERETSRYRSVIRRVR